MLTPSTKKNTVHIKVNDYYPDLRESGVGGLCFLASLAGNNVSVSVEDMLKREEIRLILFSN